MGKDPFEIALVENIGGVEIPMISSGSKTVRALKEAIAHIATETFINISAAYDDSASGSDKALSTPPRIIRKGQKHMASFVGEAPQAAPLTTDKVRRTLTAVRTDLFGLRGFDITFSAVLNILLTRWNSNCYRHMNDKKIASFVHVLLERDDSNDVEQCEQRINTMLTEMDRHTDAMDARRDKSDWNENRKLAPVITLRKTHSS